MSLRVLLQKTNQKLQNEKAVIFIICEQDFNTDRLCSCWQWQPTIWTVGKSRTNTIYTVQTYGNPSRQNKNLLTGTHGQKWNTDITGKKFLAIHTINPILYIWKLIQVKQINCLHTHTETWNTDTQDKEIPVLYKLLPTKLAPYSVAEWCNIQIF